jgi:hypothetical protein
MTDPLQATLWLVAAAVTVLILCVGGTLLAAGIWRWPSGRSVRRTVGARSVDGSRFRDPEPRIGAGDNGGTTATGSAGSFHGTANRLAAEGNRLVGGNT